MCTTNTQCLDFKGLELDKYKQLQNKKETIFLWFNTSATSMVLYTTGVQQKSIFKFKRYLENQDFLKFCNPAGLKACYLTKNFYLLPKSNHKKTLENGSK